MESCESEHILILCGLHCRLLSFSTAAWVIECPFPLPTYLPSFFRDCEEWFLGPRPTDNNLCIATRLLQCKESRQIMIILLTLTSGDAGSVTAWESG